VPHLGQLQFVGVFRQVISIASNFIQIVYRQLMLVFLLGLVSHFLFFPFTETFLPRPA